MTQFASPQAAQMRTQSTRPKPAKHRNSNRGQGSWTRTRTRIEKYLAPLYEAELDAYCSKPRFALRNYLQAVYRLYKTWEQRGVAIKRTRWIASVFKLPMGPTTHPLKILIDITSPQPDRRARSRLVRALEYAATTDVRPADLGKLFRKTGGVIGCARQMAALYPKRRTRNRWDD
jgi:hypothetical protein